MYQSLTVNENTIWSNLIQEFETEIKNGNGTYVLNKIKKIKSIPMDNHLRIDLSNQLRRIGESKYSLVLLRPVLKNVFGDYYENKFFSNILANKFKCKTEIENKLSISYAAGLRNIGCIDESLALLDTITELDYPESLLQKSIGYFKKWDYFHAVPLLKKYIKLQKNNNYNNLVGLVNLAASYTGIGKFNLSNKYLKFAKRKAIKLNAKLLMGNILEIETQNLYNLGLSDQVNQIYLEAQKYLENSGQIHLLYLNKWNTLSKLKLNQLNINPYDKSDFVLDKLNFIKNWAIRLNHWETVRDMDYHISVIKSDYMALLKLKQITPHKSFKLKIINHLKQSNKNQSLKDMKLFYDSNGFNLNNSNSGIKNDPSTKNNIFDLTNWTWNNTPLQSLKKNSSYFSLLYCFISDPYQEHSVGKVFSDLFPNQVFDPIYSVDRITKLVNRCNSFLTKNNIPVQIKSSRSFYSLIIKNNIIFTINVKNNTKKTDFIIQKYYKQLKSNKIHSPLHSTVLFTNKMLVKIWSCSDRQARRITNELLENKMLIAVGNGRNRSYKLL